MLERTIAAIFGLALAAIALLMLAAPRTWYDVFPGVVETGAFNAHFIRDLGCAFIVQAGVLLAYAFTRSPPVSAVVAVAAFVTLHALVHIGELLAMPGHAAAHVFVRDLPAVYMPAVLTFWFAVSAACGAVSVLTSRRSST